MKKFGKFRKEQVLNVLLRMLPLLAKLVLTLYMGRYFSLKELGVYGLVFGTAIVLNTVLGQGFGYIVGRDIVRVSPVTVLHKIRDQALLFGVNYLLLILAAFLFYQSGLATMPLEIIVLTVILAILESFATLCNNNMNSLHQQLMANAMFFVRAGLWVVPVIALGMFDPAFRTVDVVLIAWCIGGVAGIAGSLWHWRSMPWRKAMFQSVDWAWLRKGLKTSTLIWLGLIGLSCGTFVDRFVVDHYLSLDDVGVVTFYFSFASAMLTLMQSGVLSFAYPRLIAMHKDGEVLKFKKETRQAFWQVALGSGLIALTLAVIVPFLGFYTERPALVSSAVTLWLMLFGAWIRSVAETLNYVLYARHQDRAIWLGNLLFLVPAVGGNALLVPLLGLPGIGWASIIAGAFLFLWRWKYVGSLKHE